MSEDQSPAELREEMRPTLKVLDRIVGQRIVSVGGSVWWEGRRLLLRGNQPIIFTLENGTQVIVPSRRVMVVGGGTT